MNESFNNKPHIAQNLEKRLRLKAAPCHVNGNAKTSEVTRTDEYGKLFNNIVSKAAKEFLASDETFSVFNNTRPHYFQDTLALACEYSGVNSGAQVRDPRTDEELVYRLLVGQEYERAVKEKAQQLQ